MIFLVESGDRELHVGGHFVLTIEGGQRIVQVGVRAQSKDENEFRKRNGIRTFYAREIKMGMYGENWQEMAARILSENVYITFDLDGFDPSVLPATGRPEPGGLFWDETLNLLKIVCHDKNIVGIDITGLVPSRSNGSSNYTAAKLLYKILNYASMLYNPISLKNIKP